MILIFTADAVHAEDLCYFFVFHGSSQNTGGQEERKAKISNLSGLKLAIAIKITSSLV